MKISELIEDARLLLSTHGDFDVVDLDGFEITDIRLEEVEEVEKDEDPYPYHLKPGDKYYALES